MKLNQVIRRMLSVLIITGLMVMAGCTADIETLISKGDVKGLIRALKDEDTEIAELWQIIAKLGELGDERAVEPLIEALNDDDRGGIRERAAEALGELGDERAVEPLIAALKDDSEYVRKDAAEALVKIGSPAVEPLIAALKDKYAHRFAAQALGGIGDARAVEPLIIALKDEREYVRKDTIEALVRIGSAAVEPLTVALKDDDRNVREGAAEVLVEIGDARAVEPLIEALKDSYVRSRAAEALINIGTTAVEPLIEALNDDDRNVRKGAANALVAIGTPAVEPLIEALNDDDSDVREHVAEVLVRIDDERAVEPLISLFGFDMPGDHGSSAITRYYTTICAAFTSVVNGQGVAEAASYNPEIPGPHPLVVLQTDGSASEWNASLSPGWAPISQSEVELVVVVGEQDSVYVETVHYSGGIAGEGMDIKGYRNRVDVQVYEARTATVLKSTTLYGPEPRYPDMLPMYRGFESIGGGKVSFNDFLQWWTGED